MTTVHAVSDLSPITLEELTGTTLVVSIPAAFSGTCTRECIPGVIKDGKRALEAGIDRIIVVCTDGPHAVKAWIREQNWGESGLIFASDFGSFQLRQRVGKISDEEGKAHLPQVVGNQLRRSYILFRDGKILWEYVEPDSATYTFSLDSALSALS